MELCMRAGPLSTRISGLHLGLGRVLQHARVDQHLAGLRPAGDTDAAWRSAQNEGLALSTMKAARHKHKQVLLQVPDLLWLSLVLDALQHMGT